MERVFSSKLAVETQIREHSRSRSRRLVAQNPKISLFRENQVSSCGSILTLFFHETAAYVYLGMPLSYYACRALF